MTLQHSLAIGLGILAHLLSGYLYLGYGSNHLLVNETCVIQNPKTPKYFPISIYLTLSHVFLNLTELQGLNIACLISHFFFYLQHFVILKAFIVPAGSIPGPDVPNNNTPVARVKGTSTRLLIVLLVLISGNIKPNLGPGTDLSSL